MMFSVSFQNVAVDDTACFQSRYHANALWLHYLRQTVFLQNIDSTSGPINSNLSIPKV